MADALVFKDVVEKEVAHDDAGRITKIRETTWVPEPPPDPATLEAAAGDAVGRIVNLLGMTEYAQARKGAPLSMTIWSRWASESTRQQLLDAVNARLRKSSIYSALLAEGKWTLNLDVKHGSPGQPAVDAGAKQQVSVTPSRRYGFRAE